MLILNKRNEKILLLVSVSNSQIDKLECIKYNVLEHAKFLNNLYELKNILLF